MHHWRSGHVRVAGFDHPRAELGVAGTMVANGSGIQKRTLFNLLMAWVLTLPAAMLLAGSLYWLLSHIF